MKKLIFSVLMAVLLIACTRNNDSPDKLNLPGKLVVSVTDDPFNISFIESASVTITKIEIRKDVENKPDTFLVLSEVPVTLDLLGLRNGIKQELLNLEVPQGDYDQIRLYVDQASLKLKDHPDTFNVKVPSGKQSGIKINIDPAIIVEGGLTSELILDFDLSRSFVMRGNLAHSAGVNGFIFKPCIRAANKSAAGIIEGMVSDNLLVKLADAKLWLEMDSVFATTFTDTLGHYAFIGVPAGIYSIFATKENYDTVNYTGINVIPGNLTIKNFVLTAK